MQKRLLAGYWSTHEEPFTLEEITFLLVAVQFHAAQPLGVGDHADAGEGHRPGRQNGCNWRRSDPVSVPPALPAVAPPRRRPLATLNRRAYDRTL